MENNSEEQTDMSARFMHCIEDLTPESLLGNLRPNTVTVKVVLPERLANQIEKKKKKNPKTSDDSMQEAGNENNHEIM